MKTKSLKAKGRRLQNKIRELLINELDIPAHDIDVAIMGEGGVDVKIHSSSLHKFPYAIECKNVERINIWKAWEQAEAHVLKGDSSAQSHPLLIFSKNRHTPLAVLDVEHLIGLYKNGPLGRK